MLVHLRRARWCILNLLAWEWWSRCPCTSAFAWRIEASYGSGRAISRTGRMVLTRWQMACMRVRGRPSCSTMLSGRRCVWLSNYQGSCLLSRSKPWWVWQSARTVSMSPGHSSEWSGPCWCLSAERRGLPHRTDFWLPQWSPSSRMSRQLWGRMRSLTIRTIAVIQPLE